MDKRLFKVAAIFAWAIQGIFMSWIPMPAHAANPDTIRLTVRAGSPAPPMAITDLLASPNLSAAGQISITWTAPQGYSADITGASVSKYFVHYATYSID